MHIADIYNLGRVCYTVVISKMNHWRNIPRCESYQSAEWGVCSDYGLKQQRHAKNVKLKEQIRLRADAFNQQHQLTPSSQRN